MTTCLLWKQADLYNSIWGHEKRSWKLSDSFLAYIACDQYPGLGQFQWHHKTRPCTDYRKIWINVSGHMSTIFPLIKKWSPPHRFQLLQDHGYKRGHLQCVTMAPMAAQASQIQWVQLQPGSIWQLIGATDIGANPGCRRAIISDMAPECYHRGPSKTCVEPCLEVQSPAGMAPPLIGLNDTRHTRDDPEPPKA